MALPPPLAPPFKRVVVTGLGVVSPLGVGAKQTWSSLVAGDCGVRPIRCGRHTSCRLAAPPARQNAAPVLPLVCAHSVEGGEDLPARIAARVPRLDGETQRAPGAPPLFDAAAHTTHSRSQGVPFIEFALAAAAEALADARWAPEVPQQRQRTGVTIGSGVGSVEEVSRVAQLMQAERGYRKVSPFFIPRTLINLAAGHVSIEHGLQVPPSAHRPRPSAIPTCARLLFYLAIMSCNCPPGRQ